jgi:hypothetical protein
MVTHMEQAMNPEIQVFHKSVYGKTLIYPANELAHKFAKLLNTKTFNRETIAGLKDMGYTVGQVIGELSA